MPTARLAAPSKDVDAYIAAANPKALEILNELRALIRKAAPQAEERLRMGTPTYNLNGPLVSFAVAAKHCSFYVMSRGPITRHKDELVDFDTAPSAIRFAHGDKIPKAVISAIVKERVAENSSKG